MTDKPPQFPAAFRKTIGIILLFGTIGMASCQAAFQAPLQTMLGS